jgi:hypothetical protein
MTMPPIVTGLMFAQPGNIKMLSMVKSLISGVFLNDVVGFGQYAVRALKRTGYDRIVCHSM